MSEGQAGIAGRARESIGSIDGKSLGIAIVAGLIPAIGLAVELAFTFREASPWMFWIPWAGFTFLVYRHRPLRNKVAAVVFYLAVEAFLLPVAALATSFLFVGEQQGGFSQLGAAIGGGVITVAAAIVGFAVGIVLWLISNRLEIEKVEAVNVSEGR